MAFDRTKMRPGMKILGADGSNIGEVKEVRDDTFEVGRMLRGDLHIPYSAINSCTEEACLLDIPSDKVDEMKWTEEGGLF